MHLGSKGYAAVGMGHLLSTIVDAQKLAFKNAGNKSASKAEIKTDYGFVKKQPANRLVSSSLLVSAIRTPVIKPLFVPLIRDVS